MTHLIVTIIINLHHLLLQPLVINQRQQERGKQRALQHQKRRNSTRRNFGPENESNYNSAALEGGEMIVKG